MKRKLLVIGILIVFFVISGFSQDEWIHYDVLNTTPENDLSSNYIKRLYIDGSGCYWMLTFYYGITKYENDELFIVTNENGLASNMPRDIFEDSSGNIWITYSDNQGITKYDGQTYEHFSTDNYLPGNEINGFFEDSGNNIWLRFGTNDTTGVSVYDGNSWITYNSGNGLASDFVREIKEDTNGDIYLIYKYNTSVGFSVFSSNIWSTYTINDGLLSDQVAFIHPAANGDIWISYDEFLGVTKYSNGIFYNYTVNDGLLSNRAYIAHEDISGNIWFRCFNMENGGVMDGISKYDGTGISSFTIENGLAASFVTEFFDDSDGNIWINYYPQYNGGWGNYGEPVGITKYDGTNFTTITEDDGLASNLVSRLYEDGGNNLWFNHNSTYSQAYYTGNPYGLTKWNGSEFIVYDTMSGLISNHVYSISEESNGNIWFTYWPKIGISVMENQAITTYTMADGLTSNGSLYFKEDFENRVVLVSSNGLSVYDGGWSRIMKEEGLQNNGIHSMSEDDEGALYFTSEDGAVRYNGFNWRPYTICDGLAINQTTDIYNTENHGLWFNHNFNWEAGINRYDGINWTAYDTNNYLSSNIVKKVYEDTSGDLWFVYSGQAGITKYDGQNWFDHTTADGLHSDYIEDVVSDNDGNIWAFSESGASMYDGEIWTSFNSSNGLAHDMVESIFVSSGGDIWFTYPFWTDELCSFPWQITKFDGDSWESFLPDESWHTYDRGVKEDLTGQLWIVAATGVIFYDGINWELITTEDGLISNGVSDVYIRSDNSKWFLTNGGITVYNGSEWESYTEDDVLVYNKVSQILEDKNGYLWLKYRTAFSQGQFYGVTRFDGNEWVTFDEENGLASNRVNELYEDNVGYIWAISDKGLDKFTGNVGIYENPSPLFESIMTISPNPLHNQTEIGFYLSDRSLVEVLVHNCNGKLIKTLCSQYFSKGEHAFVFSLDKQPHGLYYCSLKINGKIMETGKIIKQ